MFPADENRQSNPYTAIFADGLRRMGWHVSSPGWRARLFERADIVHVHWPQRSVDQPSRLAALRSFAMWTLFLRLQKARGARIVWTTHNLTAHDSRQPGIEARYMALFTRLVDGIVSLSPVNADNAVRSFPALRGKPAVVIPHPLYGGEYPVAAAVRQLPVTISVLGDIKPYKGLDRLLEALDQAEPDQRHYLIAGKCGDAAAAAALDAKISALCRRGWSIERSDARLSAQQMVDSLARSHLLLLPYHRGENSGLALLAAERGVPMLMTRLSGFDALAAELGDGNAQLFEPPLTHAKIALAADALAPQAGQPPAGLEERRGAGVCTAALDNFLQRLIAGVPSTAS